MWFSYDDDFALVVEVFDRRQSLLLEEADSGGYRVDVVVHSSGHVTALKQTLLQQVLLAVEHEAEVTATDLWIEHEAEVTAT